jgi:hypothetical protein
MERSGCPKVLPPLFRSLTMAFQRTITFSAMVKRGWRTMAESQAKDEYQRRPALELLNLISPTATSVVKSSSPVEQ